MDISVLFLSQYDNILMEESAQILEIETFIPLLLQVRLLFKNVLQKKNENWKPMFLKNIEY